MFDHMQARPIISLDNDIVIIWLCFFCCKYAPIHYQSSFSFSLSQTNVHCTSYMFIVEDFDRRSVFSLCFRPRAVCHLISDWSNGPSLTIDVPDNDSGRMGLLLCAHFTVPEHESEIFRTVSTLFKPPLSCVFRSNVDGTEPKQHFHRISTEEFRLLWTSNGFHSLSYIPLALFGDWLNQCSCLKATFSSSDPGLKVEKCTLRFFHVCGERQLIHDSIPLFETQRLISQLEAFLEEKTEDEDKEKPNSTNRSDEDSP